MNLVGLSGRNFKPVNHAIITDTAGSVNGPLTAGVIPWGYGNYTLEKLSKADLTGIETEINKQKQIQLIVLRADGTEETFTLEPAKDYAVKQYSTHPANGTFVLRVYDNYQQVGGKWYPGDILIEVRDESVIPAKLIARDIWDITSIDSKKPSSSDFEVSYELDSYIEDFCFGDEPLQYRYSAPQPPPPNRVLHR